jgi:hypothetical protein
MPPWHSPEVELLLLSRVTESVLWIQNPFVLDPDPSLFWVLDPDPTWLYKSSYPVADPNLIYVLFLSANHFKTSFHRKFGIFQRKCVFDIIITSSNLLVVFVRIEEAHFRILSRIQNLELRSESNKKVRILADPDPQHCTGCYRLKGWAYYY